MMEKSPRIAAFLRQRHDEARDFVFIPMTAFTAALGILPKTPKKQSPAFIDAAQLQLCRDHKDDSRKANLLRQRRD